MSLFSSQLHDETTFYTAFLKDLENCDQEAIIESPYITSERMNTLKPTFRRLVDQGVKVYIITRDPREHDLSLEIQAENEIQWCEFVGVQVLLCKGNHHRKLAFLDKKILWEGSLNILSQSKSREIMRRIQSEDVTKETFRFLKFNKVI